MSPVDGVWLVSPVSTFNMYVCVCVCVGGWGMSECLCRCLYVSRCMYKDVDVCMVFKLGFWSLCEKAFDLGNVC